VSWLSSPWLHTPGRVPHRSYSESRSNHRAGFLGIDHIKSPWSRLLPQIIFGLYLLNSAYLMTLFWNSALVTNQPSSTTCSCEPLICRPTYFSWLWGPRVLNQSWRQPAFLIPFPSGLDRCKSQCSKGKEKNFTISSEIMDRRHSHIIGFWSKTFTCLTRCSSLNPNNHLKQFTFEHGIKDCPTQLVSSFTGNAMCDFLLYIFTNLWFHEDLNFQKWVVFYLLKRR
jgi:hypothetical protein